MNFKHILSRSSSSSQKSFSNSEELTKLHCDIESLKKVVESLKISVESRDAAIGTLARQKEKVYVELKSAQRTIQELQQQLVDERSGAPFHSQHVQNLTERCSATQRASSLSQDILLTMQWIQCHGLDFLYSYKRVVRDIHLKEKSYLIEEIQNLSGKEDFEGINSISNDEEIIDSLRDQILAKDDVICTVCTKFMKLKTIQSSLQNRLRRLQSETQETYETMILLLQENKATMDNLFEKLIRYSVVSRSSKKYLKSLKMNVKLHYENVQLKMSLLRISRSVEEHKTEQSEDKDTTDAASSHEPRSTMVASENELENNPKPHKGKMKLPRPKLKLNKTHSPSVISNFYKERKSLSAELQETLSKSSSMPCLR